MIKLNRSVKATIYTTVQFTLATCFPFTPWVWVAITALTLACICCAMEWSYSHGELNVDFDDNIMRFAFAGLMLGAGLGMLSGAALGVSLGILK